MKEYFVYILKCNDDSYYVGLTNNIENRVHQHNLGLHEKSYTYSRRPVHVVYASCFTDVWEAIACEKRLKRWSRNKKEALIRGDWSKLQKLSRSSGYFIYCIVAMVRQAHHDNILR